MTKLAVKKDEKQSIMEQIKSNKSVTSINVGTMKKSVEIVR